MFLKFENWTLKNEKKNTKPRHPLPDKVFNPYYYSVEDKETHHILLNQRDVFRMIHILI